MQDDLDVRSEEKDTNVYQNAENDSSEDSDDEDFETYQNISTTETLLENISSIIDRLYRLGFKIRNPSTRLGFSGARKYQEIDEETGVDLMRVFAAFDHQHMEQAFLQLWKAQEIRDVKDHYLVKRLAKANTRRRQQFRQWRNHRKKIEVHSNPAEDFNLLIPSSRTARMMEAPVQEIKSIRTPGQAVPSIPSTVTRLDPNVVMFDDTASILSSSTDGKFSSAANSSLPIPRLPKKANLSKEFECPYCYILCPARTRSPQAWKSVSLKLFGVA